MSQNTQCNGPCPAQDGWKFCPLHSSAFELYTACLSAIPCLEDWVNTTGFGEVNKRDRAVLQLLKEAVAKVE